MTFRRSTGAPEPGVIKGSQVISISPAGFSDVLSVIAAGDSGQAQIEKFVEKAPANLFMDLAAVRLLAPIPRPGKFICVGLNYRDHAIESNMEIPSVPTIFNKFATSVIGPGENIVLPKNSQKPDYEGEMAVVIGKGGRYITEDNWREHVFGYMIVNDVSARDYQMATTQWLMGKTFDTFGVTGPWLTSADEIADPHALDIQTRISGELLQNSNTKHLIFPIPVLIAHLSSVLTLEPGDIISTGTPAGVGFGFKPPRWLRPGDECVISVQGLGELRNPVVAE
ncbi:MAG TPA: fumarylacetoacetate hydrolase family protein [Bryobacteraceae bacterium]|nr:fumarylacetoacetate hydrolase family protein [Bryobacteraceae bacterium]